MGAGHRRSSSAGPQIHKPVDAWWTVIVVDPIAGPVTRWLGPIRAVTPTRVTLTAHAIGVLCAVLFAANHLVAAAILFELRFVLDCIDGKLARLRSSSSNVGRYLDYVGDIVVVTANLSAIAFWAWRSDAVAAPTAALLPISFLLCLVCGAAREQEAAHADVGTRRPEARRRLETGVRARLAARRLRPLPGRVDIEHMVLFVAPILAQLLDESSLLVAAGAVAVTFFSYRSAKFLGAAFLIAQSVDRRSRSPHDEPITTVHR